MKLNYIEIGDRIREIRESIGMSQIAFAEMIGVSREHVGRIERSPKQPSVQVLADIVRQTGYSVDYILFGSSSRDSDRIYENRCEMLNIIRRMNALIEKM